MAKATLTETEVEVTKMVTVTEKLGTITLELSLQEANVVKRLMIAVVGGGQCCLAAKDVEAALSDAGVTHALCLPYLEVQNARGLRGAELRFSEE